MGDCLSSCILSDALLHPADAVRRGDTGTSAVLQALSLRNAMSMFYKIKNFKTCATFCRRLLELNPSAQVRIGSHEERPALHHALLPTPVYLLFVACGCSIVRSP
jgi:Coatomer (COPI) alpha subunit C-terminus